MARRRSSALVTLAAVASAHAHTADAVFSFNGLFGLFSRSSSDTNATFLTASRTKVTQLATCIWYGSYDKRSASAGAPLDALELSGRLDGEDTIRTYPTYPHAPVLVSVASCERVVLRWKSASDERWPVQEYTLERYPDATHRNAWSTLVNSSGILDTYTDARVRPGTTYSYRVQAISTGNVSSAYAFDQVAIHASACSSRALFGLVPLDLFTWSSLTNWSCEAVRTLGLLIICFLSVFAVMRASVTRLQGTRARSYRLKRIHKSAAESAGAATRAVPLAAAVPARPALTDRSSSESSSTTPSSSDVLDPQLASHRSVDSASSMGTLRESFEREQSFATPAGIRPSVFERDERAITLCRKCGYQAPVGLTRASIVDDASAAAAAMAAADGRRSSLSASRESVLESERNVKIKTICRNCCEDVYRYSTATRPSMARSSVMLAQQFKQSMSK